MKKQKRAGLATKNAEQEYFSNNSSLIKPAGLPNLYAIFSPPFPVSLNPIYKQLHYSSNVTHITLPQSQ